MRLSPTDQLLLAVGFVMILVTSIYVPLIDCSYEGGVCIKGGYNWLWKIGSPAAPLYSVDKFRLFLEWVAITALVGIFWVFTRDTGGRGPGSSYRYKRYLR